jgi:hypothetical protein
MNGSMMILRSHRFLLVFSTVVFMAAFTAPSAYAVKDIRIVNSTIDFGRVTQSKIITSNFFVKATGDEPVKITMLWSR